MANASVDSPQATLDELLEDPSYYQDPYPVFARLRAEAPVYWHQEGGTWLITRYDDVDMVFRSPKLFSNYGFQNVYFERFHPELRATVPTLELRGRSPSILTADPPNHTRLRRLLNVVFSSKAIAALRPRAQGLVRDLLDRADGKEVIDFVRDFAYPLPAMMIADIMGVPREDRDIFKQASAHIMVVMGRNNPNAELTVEVAREADNAFAEFRDYLRGLIAERTRSPRDDVISVLSHAEFDGDRLSGEELLSNLVIFLIAGHETTTGMISSGLYLLTRDPEQLQLLRDRPNLVGPAIEEILRYEPPAQRLRRTMVEAVELHGVTLPKGEPLEVLPGAANRDESKWEKPEKFDIQRKPVPHLTFGRGIHFCIGSPLAHLEGEVVFEELLKRFRSLELPDPAWNPDWVPVNNLRMMKSLPLKVRRA